MRNFFRIYTAGRKNPARCNVAVDGRKPVKIQSDDNQQPTFTQEDVKMARNYARWELSHNGQKISTEKLEYSIRRGYYTKNDDGSYTVELFYFDFHFKGRISANNFNRVCDIIRRKDWRSSVDNYAGEHNAVMSDIMDAYKDYQLSMAY